MRSIYGAMLDNGMPMAEIDRMEYGLYMQIVRERAARRAARRETPTGRAAYGAEGRRVVELRRGFIDDVW